MKNATKFHESHIAATLVDLGCSAIECNQGAITAIRHGSDDESYPLTVEVYEDDNTAADYALRFRARVSRQFGLPVVYHHGSSIKAALESVQWRLLDRAPNAVHPLLAFAGA